jgi:hypothetical protein
MGSQPWWGLTKKGYGLVDAVRMLPVDGLDEYYPCPAATGFDRVVDSRQVTWESSRDKPSGAMQS